MRHAIVLTLALAGCATQQDLAQRAASASDFKVCRAVILAPAEIAAIGRSEAARRGLDCAPYTQAVLQNEQANNQATNQLINSLLTPSPIQQAPRPISCTSRRSGNQVFADCN